MFHADIHTILPYGGDNNHEHPHYFLGTSLGHPIEGTYHEDRGRIQCRIIINRTPDDIIPPNAKTKRNANFDIMNILLSPQHNQTLAKHIHHPTQFGAYLEKCVNQQHQEPNHERIKLINDRLHAFFLLHPDIVQYLNRDIEYALYKTPQIPIWPDIDHVIEWAGGFSLCYMPSKGVFQQHPIKRWQNHITKSNIWNHALIRLKANPSMSQHTIIQTLRQASIMPSQPTLPCFIDSTDI